MYILNKLIARLLSSLSVFIAEVMSSRRFLSISVSVSIFIMVFFLSCVTSLKANEDEKAEGLFDVRQHLSTATRYFPCLLFFLICVDTINFEPYLFSSISPLPNFDVIMVLVLALFWQETNLLTHES